MRDTICFSIESRVTRAAADQVEGITKPKEDQFRGDLKCGVAIERTARSLADAPPTAPLGVGYILIPRRGVSLTVIARREDVQLVRIARHGGHRRPGLCRHIADAPPAAPLGVRYVLVPGRGIDAAISAHEEDVQLVGVPRDSRNRTAGRNRAGQDVPPAAPLR